MRLLPLSFIVLSGLGLLCLPPAVASLLGVGGQIHPILADSGAGIALLVTAISLVLSGLFPLALRRLAQREAADRKTGGEGPTGRP